MKVWVVICDDIFRRTCYIEKIYSTKQSAQNYVKKRKKYISKMVNFVIEEWEVDDDDDKHSIGVLCLTG